MSTIAVGDIHGNLRALNDLLEKVLPILGKGDTLVFLGDYIDRGPDSRGCLERIVGLKKDSPFSIVTLSGNHEVWMLKSWRDPTSHSWIFAGQGFTTVESYSLDAGAIIDAEIDRYGPRLITERISLPYEAFFNAMPPEHLDFLESLEPCHQSEDVICVHGGVELNGQPVQQQSAQELIWGPIGFPDQYRGLWPVVYGHHDNAVVDASGWPSPYIGKNGTCGIDTISHGVLTAISFPSRKIVQSGQYLEELL
jgi:serine/threonine protein phosphatase 1